MSTMMLFAQASAEAAPLDLAVRLPLSIMTFLEFAVWGAWYVVLGNYLNSIGFSRKEIGRVYATIPLGAIISPMFVGAIADRYFASEQLMAILHVAGAGLLCWMAYIRKPVLFYWVALGYALVYTPTLSLSNAVVFANVPTSLDFPEIRVLGTIGWIAAGMSLRLFIKSGQQVNNSPLLLGAALSAILGVYSFFLPHTPPLASGSGAKANAVMGVTLEVAEKGSGYTTAPKITFEGGGGSGAAATAEVKDGQIVNVTMTDVGRGYTSIPKVAFPDGGTGAVIKSSLQIVDVEVVSSGSGYKAKRIVTVLAEKGSGAALEAMLNDKGGVTAVTIGKDLKTGKPLGGSGYEAPPTLKFPEPGIPFVDALSLLKTSSGAVFFGVSFLITIALAFYYAFTALYFEQGLKVKPENIGPLMTIGQWVEIIFLLTLSWFIKEWGMRYVLIIGMAAWGIRYAIFAAMPPLGLAIIGIALHGICFDFFLAAGMMHTADISSPEIQASAQSLFGVLTYGLGMYFGTEAAGWLNQHFTRDVTDPATGVTTKVTDWRSFWMVPCIGALVCLGLFVVFF